MLGRWYAKTRQTQLCSRVPGSEPLPSLEWSALVVLPHSLGYPLAKARSCGDEAAAGTGQRSRMEGEQLLPPGPQPCSLPPSLAASTRAASE